MSRQITTAQLWESIRNSGLASADDCRKWARGVSDGLGKSIASDPEPLIAALVKFGYLTPYQGMVLLQDPTQPLVLEGIKVEKSLEEQLGVYWYEGRPSALKAASQPSSPSEKIWLATISLNAIVDPSVSSWPPSVTWAEHHMRIRSPYLDRWHKTGATLQHLFAIAEPWIAKPLAIELQTGPLHADRVLQMVQDVASGLHALHEAGLVHGHLGLESILVEPDGSFRLRRDPFFPPRSPYLGNGPSLISQSHSLLSVASPELAIPEVLPTVRSDLYALGCIWYRSITGHWPVEPSVGSSPVTWASLHARIPVETPEGLSELSAKCLLHLLAKDPSARFSSAKAFLNALQNSPNRSSDSHEIRSNPNPNPNPAASQAVREPSVDYVQKPIAPPERKPSASASPNSSRSHTQSADSTIPQKKKRDKAPKLLIPMSPSAESAPAKPSIPASGNVATSEPMLQPGSDSKPASNNRSKRAQPKRGKAKSQRPFWIMPLLVAGSCLLLIGLVFFLRNRSPSIVTIANTPTKPATKPAAKPSKASSNDGNRTAERTDPLSERFEIRADDGKLPWAPPTTGLACSTDLLPSGIEAIAYFSSRAWQHQGPIAPIVEWWKSIAPDQPSNWWPETALPTDAIEQVAVAWYPGTQPRTSRNALRFTFQKPRKISEIIDEDIWSPQPMPGKAGSNPSSIWIRNNEGSLSAMLCDNLSGSLESTTKHATFGPPDLLKTIPESLGAASQMRRQLDLLRQASDTKADLTVLIAPSFLYGDGKNILGPERQSLLELLRVVIDDNVQALSLRAQWDKDWYVEWRSLGNDLQAASRNAASVKSSIETVSNSLETALVTQPADPYWRAIANRFPQMLRALAKWTRTGSEEGQVIANAYLPQEALPNLLIGSWMASQRNWSNVDPAPLSTKPEAPSKTIDQWLETPITLRVEQDSLENLLQSIATELKEVNKSPQEPLPMAINGAAFQKEGITRNQQIRNFDFTNTPIRQVLTALARKANPVTTVQSPNEKDQKVIWLVLDDPTSASKKRLELTTRTWSEANNSVIPNEFVLPK